MSPNQRKRVLLIVRLCLPLCPISANAVLSRSYLCFCSFPPADVCCLLFLLFSTQT